MTRAADDSCIRWDGAFGPDGYGRTSDYVPGRTRIAHRWVYEREVGPLSRGLVVHHTCENKACVNPNHLQAMTHKEHQAVHGLDKYREALWAERRSRTHCPQGHEYTPDNTRSKRGSRECRTCLRERNRLDKKRRRDRRRAAA